MTVLILSGGLFTMGTGGIHSAPRSSVGASGSSERLATSSDLRSTGTGPAAGFPRTVLVEAFGGVWCTHCPPESQALYNLSQLHAPNFLDVAELHVCAFAPGTGPCLDPYRPVDNTSEHRASFYGVVGYPGVVFDGDHSIIGAANSVSQMESMYASAIANASAIPANVSIVQGVTFGSGGVTDHVAVNSSVTGSFNAVSYLVEYIGNRNVSIGYGSDAIGWVVRETLVNHPVNLTAGSSTLIDALGPLNSSWNRANLSALTFVQQNSTKIVENANLAPVTNRSARFSIAFDEAGLPAGTPWSVDLNGSRFNGTASALRSSPLPPGTYNFTVSARGYRADVDSTNRASGSETVDVVNETVFANFTSEPPELFPLVFHELGLPNGTGWGVLLGSGSQTSFGPNVTYSEPNGSYGYVVLAPTGFVTTYPGPATVNGSATLVPVRFHPQTYPIVFVEFGLPAGSNWSVTVSNGSTGFNVTQSSVTSSVIFFLANGTYRVAFTLPPGFAGNSSTTILSVAGSSEAGPVVHAQGPSGPPGASAGSPSTTVPWASAGWVALGAGVAAAAGLMILGLRHRRRGPGA